MEIYGYAAKRDTFTVATDLQHMYQPKQQFIILYGSHCFSLIKVSSVCLRSWVCGRLDRSVHVLSI